MITDEELEQWAECCADNVDIARAGLRDAVFELVSRNAMPRLIAEVKRLRAEIALVPVRDDHDDYPALPDLGEQHLLEREAREKAAVKRRRQLDDERTQEMIATFDYWGCKITVPVESKK